MDAVSTSCWKSRIAASYLPPTTSLHEDNAGYVSLVEGCRDICGMMIDLLEASLSFQNVASSNNPYMFARHLLMGCLGSQRCDCL